MRLLTLILANTGLSFVDLGKKDIFKFHRSITGPVLSSRKVKTDHIYTIPVTPKLEALIKELGPLPWKPFVDEDMIIMSNNAHKIAFRMLYLYLNDDLREQIGYDEAETLTPHRFRHSFAMRMLNHCRLSLMVVTRMLGDNETTVRENYADYNDDAISIAFNEEMARFNKRQQEEDDDLEGEVAV